MQSLEWDYIVVGAGSAGCALTDELVRAGKTVLVIEAGGRDGSPFIKIPAGQLMAMARHDWGYQSEPDPSRYGATENWARGRVLGGSSSVNGTMYTRGAAADFDRWNLPGWSWQEVLPVFRDFEGSDRPGPLRGREGPLRIRTVKKPHVLTEAFVNAAALASGFAPNSDYNGESQEGVGYAQLTQRRGFRCSAADAFLKPLLGRKNLKLILRALVSKIGIENGRAVSVSFQHHGQERLERARDIIVCAGAINSPQLLMLSGIGDPQELRRHRIEVLRDLPGVGRNLKDQPLISPTYRTKIPSYNLTEGISQKLQWAAKFLLQGEGPISNLFEAAAFLRSSSSEPVPDLQVIFMAMGYSKSDEGQYELESYPSVMVHIMYSYPSTSGRVSLNSRDPEKAPKIECDLLGNQADVDKLVRGVEKIRRIMRTEPIAGFVAEEVLPGASVQQPADIEKYVRKHAGISFHPIGTCRMGTGPDAVVGPDLRVHGIENLWVADASVIPDHLSANTNAVCILVGKKLGKQLIARR